MATTNFVDGQTVISADWLNDVDEAVYNPASITLSASNIVNTPYGNIAAVDVQAALNELDSEKQPLDDQLTTLAGITADGATRLTTLAGITAQQATDLAAVSTFMGTVLNDPDAATGRATLGALNLQFMHVRDEKASGMGGGSSVAGDQIRTLNTVVTNTITGASLAANEVTLPAGTYRIFAIAPCYSGARHRVRLINVTDAAVAILGTGEHAGSGSSTMSTIYDRIVITATKVFNLTHYIATATATNGLGVDTSDTFTEVYTSLIIWKE